MQTALINVIVRTANSDGIEEGNISYNDGGLCLIINLLQLLLKLPTAIYLIFVDINVSQDWIY